MNATLFVQYFLEQDTKVKESNSGSLDVPNQQRTSFSDYLGGQHLSSDITHRGKVDF